MDIMPSLVGAKMQYEKVSTMDSRAIMSNLKRQNNLIQKYLKRNASRNVPSCTFLAQKLIYKINPFQFLFRLASAVLIWVVI